MELPPTWGGGSSGFELPPDQILPVGRETYAGVAAMLRKLIEVSGNENATLIQQFKFNSLIENEIMIPNAVLIIIFSSTSGISTTSAPEVTTTTTLPTSAGKY